MTNFTEYIPYFYGVGVGVGVKVECVIGIICYVPQKKIGKE
jgi:hypothetical protein